MADKRTRREFLAGAATVAATASVASCFPEVGGKWPVERQGCVDREPLALIESPAPIAEVVDEESVIVGERAEIQPQIVGPMVEDLLSILTDDDPQPWRALLPDYQDGMRIGIKVNCLNPACPTSVPVVRAVVDSLKAELGIDGTSIVVWDRDIDELIDCEFTSDSVGATVMGTIPPSGPGYEEVFCPVVHGKRTFLSRILTEETDLTINIPVLKAHGVSGITGAMKNIYGVIKNPGDFHTDINDALPALYSLVPIRTSFRLTILDALIASVEKGNRDRSDRFPKRLLASVDPVGLDNAMVSYVNTLRAETSIRPVDQELTQWLDGSYQRGLGARTYEIRQVIR